MKVKMQNDNKQENVFLLKNSSQAFAERQRNIFDQLNQLKCNLQSDGEMEVDRPQRPSVKTNRSSTRQFRGKESIFKVPQNPVNYMKTIPDFKKNPHKWTKYSLADVKDEDMSETSNTRTALAFLNKLRNNEDIADKGEEPKKIIFKKNSSTMQETNAETEVETKPSFRGSKVIMPEYVVGQKVKKEKKNRKSRITGDIKLKLDHLYEEN